MKKRVLVCAVLALSFIIISCDNINLIKAAYTGIYTAAPATSTPLTFVIVIAEGERLNLGAIKSGDPVHLLLYFYDSSGDRTDVTASAIWVSEPATIATFDDPVNNKGRLTLNTPGDVTITATYQDYEPVSAFVHINGPTG